jgi:hypothetical protein
MNCSACPNYSKALLRCKHGKVNPRTVKQYNEVVALMGLSYVCYLNIHRITLS